MKKLLIFALIISTFGIGYLLGAGDSTDTPPEQRLREIRLAASVRTALALNRHLEGSEIEVQVADSRVDLHGAVPSPGHRQLAEQIASRIEGVSDVVNRLALDPGLLDAAASSEDRSLGERLDDLTATARIKTALSLHGDIKRGDVSVSVVKGVATLSGTVPSWAARELAAKVTEDVEGVRAVHNALAVLAIDPGPAPEPAEGPGPADAAGPERPLERRVADGSIRLQIEAALTVNPYIEARRVHVAVQQGVVTLSGAVRSEADRDLIHKIAEDGWGVEGVVNTIVVDPVPEAPRRYAPTPDSARRAPLPHD